MPRLWIDVEDLFEYTRENSRPSGIQRVAFEIIKALDKTQELGFVRHAASGMDLRPIPREDLLALYATLTRPAQSGPRSRSSTAPSAPPRDGRLRKAALRLPSPIRVPMGRFLAAQVQATRHARDLVRNTIQIVRAERRHRRDNATSPFAPGRGDILLALGAPWAHPNYGRLLDSMRAMYGMRPALLIHDLIPLIYPEWCAPGLPRVFARWYDDAISACDTAFAVSNATRADMQARTPGLVVHTIPLGTPDPHAMAIGANPLGSTPGDYVLCVGTLEIRKNPALLIRAWRRMLAERGAAHTPRLVLAGRPGWLVHDVLEQLRNSDYLNGHIILIDGPDDAEIAALYRDCLFSIFPSFHEGWGLPVCESHAFGKLCLASSTPSLNEACGENTPRFDPDCTTDAIAVITRLLDDRTLLEGLEQSLRAGYRPVSWDETAEGVIRGLGAMSR